MPEADARLPPKRRRPLLTSDNTATVLYHPAPPHPLSKTPGSGEKLGGALQS
ncbi:MAG: hypothetical protein OXF84_11365 [Bacteroidetes bacterium]|nr:hypothetical protein [Bacteroidota bacterium]